MTYDEKKSLYENIMKDFAKIVKTKLNEDFIDNIKNNKLYTEPDFIKEEINKTVDNLYSWVYDPDSDIDLQKLTKVYPASNDNIHDLISAAIHEMGENCNLNWIDTSKVTDMAYLFVPADVKYEDDEEEYISDFCGDISKWDVSNVTTFEGMFKDCHFNGDITKWKISQKADIEKMFWGCNISLKNLPKCLINRMESFDFYEWDADADY